MTPVRFIVKEERACKNIAGKLRSLATFGSRAEGCWKVAPGAGLSRLSLPTPHSHSLARPARSLSHTRPFKCFHVVPSKLISGATRHLRRWKFLKRQISYTHYQIQSQRLRENYLPMPLHAGEKANKLPALSSPEHSHVARPLPSIPPSWPQGNQLTSRTPN